ncbi:MAG: 23S rRNA (adenine(2503)-C(2))-methyltransferase RlmN [Planctomycetota bacterium]|nr:23S rRNA (adenine(2503)-C(2))-methyltransferase RlmN [Planctomycetota bacterium]
MKHPENHIFSHTPESLRAWCAERGWPAFRAPQILDWIYKKGVIQPDLMTNLRPAERAQLARDMTFLSGDIVAHQQATDGTQKLLIRWHDAAMPLAPSEPPAASTPDAASAPAAPPALSLPVASQPAQATKLYETECVMIPADYDEDAEGGKGDFARKTACISSQVGCPVGCRFCASGIGGLDSNLSAARIIEQVWRLARMPGVERITNVVFMGMGEPLSNFANVTRAIRTLAAPWGLGISARKITISTVGLPQAIERLAEEFDLPVTLALSLHAPTDDIRRTLIPWAEYTTIDALLGACDKWFNKTGREITLEYTLLGGVNDRPEHAEQLATLARRLRANVNIIRYNEVRGMPFNRPRTEDVRQFQDILRRARINAHIRASRGRDIAAACGQLRHEKRAG